MTGLSREHRAPQAGWSPRTAMLIAVVLLLNIVEGLDGHLLAVSLSAVSADWQMPATSFGFAIAAGFGGGAIGGVFGGILGDRIGRRPTVLAGAILFTLATAGMAFTSTVGEVVVVRVLAGLGIGACFPPTVALVTESIAPRYKGLALGSILVCQSLGIASAGVLAPLVIPDFGWQALFLVSGAASFVVTVLAFAIIPETLGKDNYVLVVDANKSNKNVLVAGSHKLSPFGEIIKSLPGYSTAALIAAMFMTYLVISIALSWLPAFLIAQKFKLALATLSTSFWIMSAVGGSLVGGMLVIKCGGKGAATIFMIAAIAVFFTMFGVTSSIDVREEAGIPIFFALICASGLMMSAIISSLLAYATDIFPQQFRSTGIGFAHTAGKAGGFAGGWAGASSMHLDDLSSFFAVLGMLVTLMIILFTSGSLMQKRKIKSCNFAAN